VPAGARLLISCPMEVENYLRTKVPPGETPQVRHLSGVLIIREALEAVC